jgi:hypothetical protein
MIMLLDHTLPHCIGTATRGTTHHLKIRGFFEPLVVLRKEKPVRPVIDLTGLKSQLDSRLQLRE